MTTFEFKLPDIGEGVMEGEVVEWLVKPGDAVKEDDPMVEVMTDKATVTIGAPRTGVIQTLCYPVGGVAKVGDVLVVIDMAAAGAKAAPTAGATKAAKTADSSMDADDSPVNKESAATAVGDIRDGLPGVGSFHRSAEAQREKAKGNGHVGASGSRYYNPKPLATPSTRKLARSMDVDLKAVPPSGVGGRTTRRDVELFAAGAGAPASVSTKTPETSSPTTVVRDSQGGASLASRSVTDTVTAIRAPRAEGLELRKPFVGIRRRIAERMQHAKNTAAHFTFVEECHVDGLLELRDRLRPRAAAAGVKLQFLPFIMKAVVAALKQHPILNSYLDEETNELVYRNYFHIGVAAATEQGLMVPVVRDADRRSLLDLAREIDRLGEGARSGTLAPQELSGSTFTITSLGKQGGLFATPVLNHPEVGILGVHQMKEKPVVRNGEIVIGNVMLLSLSFDHRIVDGHVGAAFAYDIVGFLEDPERLFLEI
ncbi:MAG: 2-oxo acid dehydrogenase subunit E2 [Myxococcales bacterium]|nr:2-oxo acid dehydrogenase subunit E2 [Myxococcales bacterium]